MKIIPFVFYTIFILWVWNNFFGSNPKKEIEELWKEIFKYASEIGKYRDDPYMHQFTENIYKPKMVRAGNLINAILAYHFPNPDRDEDIAEYVAKNSYS